MEWALAGKALASSAWQGAHCTLAILAGCGNSLMVVWQSLQPRTAWALAACLAGSMEMLFPAADFIPASPWQDWHSGSAAGAAQAVIVRGRTSPSRRQGQSHVNQSHPSCEHFHPAEKVQPQIRPELAPKGALITRHLRYD